MKLKNNFTKTFKRFNKARNKNQTFNSASRQKTLYKEKGEEDGVTNLMLVHSLKKQKTHDKIFDKKQKTHIQQNTHIRQKWEGYEDVMTTTTYPPTSGCPSTHTTAKGLTTQQRTEYKNEAKLNLKLQYQRTISP